MKLKLAAELLNRSPFTTENGTVYLKYDRISIDRVGKNQFEVSFHYNGNKVATFDDKASMRVGDTLNIVDLDGKIEVDIE